MTKTPIEEYDSRDADYFLREAISNLKGKIDFMYFGGIDDEEEKEKLEFIEKLRISTDELYSMLNSNIIEKANKIKELNSILKSDMELAKKVQESTLPQGIDIDGLEFSTRFIPMSEVGGDIYDIAEIKPGYTRIFLADATGHGVQAALVTMIIKSEYEMLKRNISNPSELLKILSEEFYQLYKNLSSFFTCIALDIDLHAKKIIYSSAGHPVQYLIPHNGDIRPLPHTGKIIGVYENYTFQEIAIPVGRNDALLLFSDGIYEEFNVDNEEYGEERLKSLLSRSRQIPIDDMLTRAIDDMHAFVGQQTHHDDITMIAVKFK